MLLPDNPNAEHYSKSAHRDAFAQFLRFLKANLAGQTAVRVDADWASQAKIVEGFAEFVLPDRLIRQETLAAELSDLAISVGIEDAPVLRPKEPDGRYSLKDIYDVEIEAIARAAYARDYLMFGFEDWSPA